MRFVLIVVFAAMPLFAAAQPYPAKPVRIIVNFPAGGIADLYARIIGGKVQEAWGQPVVVENRTGAGGTIAPAYVARAEGVGYTLLIHHNGRATAPALSRMVIVEVPVKPVMAVARSRPVSRPVRLLGAGTAVEALCAAFSFSTARETNSPSCSSSRQ